MPPRKRRVRGHVEQLPCGSYRAVVGGIDPLTGRERRVREVCKTYAAAEKALTKLQRQVDEDQHPKSDITVRQALEQWLEVVKLEDTTRERYQDLIRLSSCRRSGTCRPRSSTPSCWSASTPGCTAAAACAPTVTEPAIPADP